MSGIVKQYGSPAAPVDGQPFPVPGARFYARRYQQGQGKPCLEMSAWEAKAEEVRRARLYISEHPNTTLLDAVKAVRHDDPILSEVARPKPGTAMPTDGSQRGKAARHVAERAAHFLRTKQAKTLAQAYTLAANESPQVAATAGLPAELTDQKHRDQAAVLRRYAGPGTATPTHRAAQTVSRVVLIRQIAAAALKAGTRQPGGEGRSMADYWVSKNFPAPRPGADRATVAAYNKTRERMVNEIVEAARRLLSDPAETAKLRP